MISLKLIFLLFGSDICGLNMSLCVDCVVVCSVVLTMFALNMLPACVCCMCCSLNVALFLNMLLHLMLLCLNVFVVWPRILSPFCLNVLFARVCLNVCLVVVVVFVICHGMVCDCLLVVLDVFLWCLNCLFFFLDVFCVGRCVECVCLLSLFACMICVVCAFIVFLFLHESFIFCVECVLC